MAKDIHADEFPESTQVKLSLFKDYLNEWLPVFISAKKIYWKTINIFDFFAGPGTDAEGNEGSPLIITNALISYYEELIKNGINLTVFLNEKDFNKFKLLKNKIMFENDDLKPYSTIVENLDFEDAFKSHYSGMNNRDSVNLIFLDQYGIKYIDQDLFHKLIILPRTDFIFFISSSIIKRFSSHANILKYINLSPDQIQNTPVEKINRLLVNYYKSLIPHEKEYYLSSFSIKKKSNVYGLIFGSGHILGIEKFLKTCWRHDPERGEANFDIDGDNYVPGQMDLFTREVAKPKKLKIFETELRSKIINCEIKNNRDLYLFTLTNGFLPKHSRAILDKMYADKIILNNSSLVLNSKIMDRDSQLTKIILKQ